MHIVYLSYFFVFTDLLLCFLFDAHISDGHHQAGRAAEELRDALGRVGARHGIHSDIAHAHAEGSHPAAKEGTPRQH